MPGRTDGAPLVSVIIPTYYRNERLPATIESVLGQSYRPTEVLVVDDSGEAHARPIASDYEAVRYVALDSNRGVNAARTEGARRAGGRYVHFLDDDDLMDEAKLDRQVRVFERTEDVGVVYTGIEKNGAHPVLPNPTARGDVLAEALMFELWPCMTSTMLIDGRVIDELLPLSDRPAATDLELMIQLARRTRFDFVDAALLDKRIDLTSQGAAMTAVDCRREIIQEYADLYAAHPDRVPRTALANTYATEGELLLLKHGWSREAIAAFVRHLRYAPSGRLKPLARVILACFGKPGWRVARRASDVLTSTRRSGSRR